MGTKLYSHDLRGPLDPLHGSLGGSMDLRLRTYDIDNVTLYI